MTPDQREMVTLLNSCTFLPGSYDKKFVRDMGHIPDDQALTARQDRFLQTIFHRFRKQIGINRHNRLCAVCTGQGLKVEESNQPLSPTPRYGTLKRLV
jgi:hypothetical protein